jgi:hypothetical protein
MIFAVWRRGGAMNKDINKTLMALVPILRMNGENVTNIEAVHDWYKAGDREYMKEVAEITYDNGTVRYADIGCDSNLTAIYDVIAVIQQITPRSKAIERIERGVYSLPSAQPEQKWIPCSETVDIPDHEVMAYDRYGAFIIGYIDCKDEQWLCESDDSIMYDPVAWCELPKPYKEEGT